MNKEEKGQGLKRHHVTDSDSGEREPTRRSKLRPAPNLTARKKVKITPSATDSAPST